MTLLAPVSWGELLDKISILRIKGDRMEDPVKLENVRHELTQLLQIRSRVEESDELARLEGELHRVNEALWVIEDEIRLCEKAGEFGARFVELARSVYKTNDRRAELKFLINILLGSDLVEEKSYERYDDAP